MRSPPYLEERQANPGVSLRRLNDYACDFALVEYASEDYRAVLQKHGLTGSMGRRGNPHDNAKVESFMKTLKAISSSENMDKQLLAGAPAIAKINAVNRKGPSP